MQAEAWVPESPAEEGPPRRPFALVPALPVPLSTYPALSRLQLRTDSEKRSLAESGLSWLSESEEKAPRKLEYDSGSLKMEPAASKWRRERPESCDDASKAGELKKPAGLGPPGPLKKGKTPPVAVTSPITHTAQSALKVAGEPGDRAQGRTLLSWWLLSSGPLTPGVGGQPACSFHTSPGGSPDRPESGKTDRWAHRGSTCIEG